MDEGPGVPLAERPQVFRRFWRRDRRRPGSAGLGLSIVARIVERVSGTVDVSTPEGGGLLVRIAAEDVFDEIGEAVFIEVIRIRTGETGTDAI